MNFERTCFLDMFFPQSVATTIGIKLDIDINLGLLYIAVPFML